MILTTVTVPRRGKLFLAGERHGDEWAIEVRHCGKVVPMAELNVREATAVIGALDDARLAEVSHG